MYYFVSDIHLGGGTPAEAKSAESRFVEWLDSVEEDATAIFICGDLFDFWFEYKRVIPKGFVRTLGRIAHLTDRGVRVVFMTGNHDQWTRDYLTKECGMEVYTTPQIFELSGKRVYVAHGDNLNVKDDILLKFINKTFRSGWIRAIFSTLVHPDLALKFGHWWSYSSRSKHVKSDFQGRENCVHMLQEHASTIYTSEGTDCHIFGHVHFASDSTMECGARVITTNDWSENPFCVVIEMNGDIRLKEI